MSYKSPIEDLKYNLSMLDYSNTIGSIERFKEYDADTLMSVVGEIGKLNEQEVVETNKIGDREGLKFVPDGAEGPDVEHRAEGAADGRAAGDLGHAPHPIPPLPHILTPMSPSRRRPTRRGSSSCDPTTRTRWRPRRRSNGFSLPYAFQESIGQSGKCCACFRSRSTRVLVSG